MPDTRKSLPLPSGQRAYVFEVSRSATELVDTVTVIHQNSRDAAFSAINAVRRKHNLGSEVALFASQRRQRVA